MPPAFFIEIMLKHRIRALTWVNCRTRPSSCAPAWRWHQGQALRVLRNLDTAGRGRSIEPAVFVLIQMKTYRAIYEELS
jgi:hypothetical protein